MAADPYRYFRLEGRELVAELSKTCIALGRSRGDRELVAKMLRAAHTLKGAARIVKQIEIAEHAHAVEDVLAPLRDGAAPARLDEVAALIDGITAKLDELPAPIAPPSARSARPTAPPTPASSGPRAPEPVLLARPDTMAIEGVLANLSQVLTEVARLRTDREARAAAVRVDHIDRELREVRQDVEKLRLQPASTLFSSLEHAARDAAGDTKRVELVGRGGDVRLDPLVLGQVHRALVQLVRNAVAHGIETTRDRRAAGKPETGRIVVSVELAGRRVVFRCEDDGRGIDVEAVKQAAEKAGQPVATDQVLARLLRGGLTTAASVTAHAGRGIGLDVVRDVAREISGEVTARTDPGRGTAIAIDAPVSMTSMHALIAKVGAITIAIPLAGVQRVIQLRTTDVTHGAPQQGAAPTGNHGAVIALDDVLVPFHALGPLLEADPPPAGRHPAVIVSDGDKLAALAVDRLLGVDEIVLRVLPPELPIDPLIWGISLDDEGMPRPVIAPAAAIAAASRPSLAELAPAQARPTVLVVDDSVTTRMLEKTILESAGYRVEVAASAEEGLEKAVREAYSLFLVDVEMPGMDGFSFVSEIRARPTLAHVPAILVTSRNAPADRQRGAAVGAQGYIVKSEFDQVALLASIRRLVGA